MSANLTQSGPGTRLARRLLQDESTMVVFGREQRTLLAETLRDVANIAAGAMVFGQFLGDQEFLPEVALLGLGLWMGLVTWAIVLTRSKP